MSKRSPVIHKYCILEQIGTGTFSTVFLGEHIKTREPVAIKMEDVSHSFPLLKHETFILHYLHSKKCLNIPLILWYGKWENWNAVVMPRYDYTLDIYIRERIHSSTSLSTIIKIFQQMIHILYQIHKHGIVHRDLKPQNFILNGSELVLLDFGFSQFYWEDMGGKHKSEESSKRDHLIGTLPFISYYVHCGLDVSRRDEVLSIIYIFVFILYGELYWEKIEISERHPNTKPSPLDKEEITSIYSPKNAAIRDMKHCEILLTYLDHHYPRYTQWTPVLSFLREMIEYIYSLSYIEMPDYDFLLHHMDHLIL